MFPVDEVLYESERTLVTVRRVDGAVPVVLKRLRGPRAEDRARHERAMLERAAGLPGVATLATTPDGDGLDVVALAGGVDGRTLAAALTDGPLTADAALRLATGLADTLAGLHRRGILHRDITPANVFLGPDGAPMLIDFGLATAQVEGPDAGRLVGTLAYVAPEQTGRTGRGVDQRADLYGLGATVYAALTGGPPFRDEDPLRLVHDILVEAPEEPAVRNADVPFPLSSIVMRLLEKEPDRRYQSAEGLAHDLHRAGTAGGPGFPLGERDFPARLIAPARPVGRTAELTALRAALAGDVSLVTVDGPAGIGRSSLLTELRSLAEQSGARYVSGRCDPLRLEADADGLALAFGVLARLLLTEPGETLRVTRQRMRAALGENAALAAGLVPGWQTVLQLPPARAADIGDAAHLESRLAETALAILRTVVSRGKPLVLAVDDMHLASAATAHTVEAIAAEGVPGLLLVLTHRADTPARADTPGRTLRLRLGGLPEDAMATLVAEALRAPVADLSGLAAEVHARTAGRPADTLALLNELRAAGTLRVGADGWTWDATALRRHLGEGDTGVRLASLVAALPEPVRDTLSVLSWLGGEATPELLGVACGHPAGAVLEALGPALDNGLAAFTGDAVRLAHERVRQAFPPVGTLGATIARRLARVPDYRGVAAELFLATGPVPEARDLFVEAAATTRVLDPKRSERYLAAALTVADGWDLLPVLLLHADRHAALYRLGRLDDADAEYRWIEENCPNPAGRVPSACLQMVSLAARMRFDAAWALGGDLLDRLDLPIPADPGRSVEPGIAALVGWGDALMSGEVVDTRPENLDEMHQARARLINHMGPMSFLAGPATMAWMQTTAHRLWTTAGPAAPLAVPISAAAFMLIAVRQDYHTGYRINRHLLAECERRGWDLAAAGVRSVFPVSAGHWHERLEDVLPVIRQSFTGLMQFGEMDMAGYLCLAPVGYQLDMASLGALDDEVTAALRLARRTGHAQLTEFMASYRQFVRAMRGETGSPGRLGDDEFDEAAYLAGLSGAPSGNIAYAIRGLAALIFRDAETARASAVEAMARVPAVPGHYQGTMTWVLGALTGVALDEATAWLTARAVDAPGNFSHLAALADAERARRDGDRWAATSRYDTALREVSRRRRPWHYALIAERAADFQLSEGNEYAGMGLLGLARDAYEGWGATAKVQALDQAHPGLRGRRADPDRLHSTSTSPSGALNNSDIDLLGVLDAARTLSSETREAKLRARVGEVLRALTGATDVTLLTGTDTDTGPRSVVRYVQRTRAAVVSEDAVRDDRFAHDPYFAGVARCALLAVPVVARGVDIAVLVLENRSSRDAFTADRLDAVRLVTGQLAVSLENAQLYASLEAKIADRTRELEKANARLEEANARLEQLAVTDPLTGLTNRRRMDTLLDSEWRRAARPKHPLSVAMIDIDHFKGYNDHYGHLGGDRCLTTVAETVAASVRSTDYVARYGGEEFCIILPETPLADALVVAERVRAAVEALREPHALSPQGIVTVSIGVAAGLPGPNGTVDTLLKLADESLYDAKRAGRNRVSTE